MSNMDNDKLIIVDNVTKTYRMGEVKVQALRGISLTVNRGEFVAVLGPSGCGKSTLLHIIGGLATPTSGSVTVDSVDMAHSRDGCRTRFRREKIGFVFQRFNLFNILSAGDNIRLPLKIAGTLRDDSSEDKVREMMDLVGLSHKMNSRPLQMSQGEQQRVAIARALICRPSILLADEPTGNLDSENSDRVLGLMKKLNDTLGQTIMMITHNHEAAAVADRRIVMRDGAVIDHNA
ncbi:MAG TPA: ABC transporter ATP-binding protein [Acidobacteriota bacterium]|nr:ABC transporter ATP-binding protein [Acidobacteriota bacterium]